MAHVEARKNILTESGLNGKSITGLLVSVSGSLTVIEVKYSGGSTFLKCHQGVVEVGGSEDFNSGTKVDLPVAFT